MSDVRTILGPLFPDVTFDDVDRAFVERRSLAVGTAGSQTRAAVEQVWPDEAFADDDVLVVETSRKVMTDTVDVPGERMADTFDGPVGPVSDLVWNPAPTVTLDGGGNAVMPNDSVAANSVLRLIATPPAAGRTAQVEWAQLANPANGYAVTGLRVARASNPANYYVQVRVSGGKILWQSYAYGGVQQSANYSAAAHRFWRIRFADQVYMEASGDGQTWAQVGAIPLPGWEGEACVYTVSAGPWDARGVSSTPNLLAGFSVA